MASDKAGKSYWDQLWSGRPMPKVVNPLDDALWNYPNIRFDALFREIFAGHGRRSSLIEIGCAGSEWLPYMSARFGFDVAGLDYSEIGCEQARAVLAESAVDGRVVLGNLFSPPTAMKGEFDIAISFGVMEHFSDTASAIRAAAALTKPGGLVVTVIPNMTGSIGMMQKWVSRSIYDKHVPLSRRALREAHESAGLEIVRSQYFLSTNFGVVNSSELRSSSRVKLLAVLWLTRLSKVIWLFERYGFRVPACGWLAPYVVCVGRRRRRD